MVTEGVTHRAHWASAWENTHICVCVYVPPQEQEIRYAAAVAAQEALAADIEAAQRRVGQAQKVLNAVRKEVERWTRNAEASELRHQQVRTCTYVCFCVYVYVCVCAGVRNAEASELRHQQVRVGCCVHVGLGV